MNRDQSFAKPFALTLCVAALAGLAGCADGGTTEAPASPSVRHVLVTAGSIAELSPNADLRIDLVDNVVYDFDYSAGPIQYTRVTLVEGADLTPMEQSMQEVADWDYGTDPAMDLLAAPDLRFSLAWDAADMEALTEAERAELLDTGYLAKVDSPKSPGTQPQTEDNCVYGVCIICPQGWGNGPCYTEQHVWCD